MVSDIGLDEGGIAQAISDMVTGVAGALQHPVITQEEVTTKTNKKGKTKTTTRTLSVTAGEVLAVYVLYLWNQAGRPNIRDMLLGNVLPAVWERLEEKGKTTADIYTGEESPLGLFWKVIKEYPKIAAFG